MEIIQMQTERQELECKIAELLKEFSGKTGLSVEDIHISHVNVFGFRHPEGYFVSLEVRL